MTKEILWSKVREASLNLALDASTHGVPNIVKSTRLFIRLIWIILLLTSAVCCVYFISKGLMEYLSYDVTTTIRIINDYTPEFPAVTICNKNPFTSPYAAMFLNNVSLSMYNMSLAKLTSFLNSSISVNEKKQRVDEFLKQAQLYAFQNLNDRQKIKLNFHLNDFVYDCRFGVRYCYQDDQFSWFYHSKFGNCWVRNSGVNFFNQTIEIDVTKREGRIDGLIIEAYVGVSELLEPFVSGYGLVIKVQNRTYSPYDMSGVEVSAGRETSIAITKTVVTQQASPYSECTVDDSYINANPNSLYNIIAASKYSFTQQFCIDLCLQVLNINHCNCYNQMYPWLDQMVANVASCFSSIETQNCSNTFYNINTNQDFIRSNCQTQCPLECNRIHFDSSVTFSQYPTDGYATYIIRGFDIISKLSQQTQTALLNNSVLKVNVYFDSLVYTEITESPSLTIAWIFSNMGGTMGLFLGMSFLSIFELIEIAFASLFICVEHKKKH